MKLIIVLNDTVEEKLWLKRVYEQYKYYSTCVLVLICPNFHIPWACDLSEDLTY